MFVGEDAMLMGVTEDHPQSYFPETWQGWDPHINARVEWAWKWYHHNAVPITYKSPTQYIMYLGGKWCERVFGNYYTVAFSRKWREWRKYTAFRWVITLLRNYERDRSTGRAVRVTWG